MAMGKTTNPNSTAGVPAKGVVVPKGAAKADMSGEKLSLCVVVLQWAKKMLLALIKSLIQVVLLVFAMTTSVILTLKKT